MIRFLRRYPIILIPLILVGWTLHAWMTGKFTDEYRLAALLDLETLPASVTDVSCIDSGLWNDHTECTGTAALSDMAMLMSRRPFVEEYTSPCGTTDATRNARCFGYRWPPRKEHGHRAFRYSEMTGRFYASSIIP